jgi:hypothetical protein
MNSADKPPSMLQMPNASANFKRGDSSNKKEPGSNSKGIKSIH